MNITHISYFRNACATITLDVSVLMFNIVTFPDASLVLFQVPFMRNWFKDQNITEWTVMMWFKREAGSSDDVGLVNNADCVDDASFAISGHVIAGNQQVSGAIAATSFPPVMVGPHTVSVHRINALALDETLNVKLHSFTAFRITNYIMFISSGLHTCIEVYTIYMLYDKLYRCHHITVFP